jgi:hypothetical protein
MTYTSYTGQRGDDYQTSESYTELDANGNTVTKTRSVTQTRWTWVSGEVQHFFDDVLICASQSIPDAMIATLEPWDLNELQGFRAEFLSGFKTERYAVSLEDGFARAREIMDGTIRQLCCQDIGGDHQQLNDVKTKHLGVTFKHLLLPVWVASYRYNDRLFQILVNARTGEVVGRRPYSVAKIVGLVVAIIVFVLMMVFLIARSQGGPPEGFATACGSDCPSAATGSTRIRVCRDHRLRGAQPVDGRADDAAGISGAFSDGIQPFDSRRRPADRVPNNPHRRTAARFRPDQYGVC